MKEYNRKKPLVSIHIPKCAGTSFRSVLKKWFKKKLYLHYFDEKNNVMPPSYNLKSGILKRRFKKGVCIHGHFNKARGFGVLDYYPEIDQFITILRDPFEVALSNYFYGIRLDQARFRDGHPLRTKNQFKDIADYFRRRSSYLLDFFPYELTLNNYEKLLDNYFVYVGVLEDIQTSINMLAQKLGLPEEVSIGYENISERCEDVLQNMREEFMNNHELEYAIYNHALTNYKR